MTPYNDAMNVRLSPDLEHKLRGAIYFLGGFFGGLLLAYLINAAFGS